MSPATASIEDCRNFLNQARVPDLPEVYLLGCLERRVTVYSQQVRALNLIYALEQCAGLQSGARIGIVGAGIAGLTAAAAALQRGFAVTLLEEKPSTVLLWRQEDCDKRWLHPHIYDWPQQDSLRDDAKLPVMTWTANTARHVVSQLTSQWLAVRKHYPKPLLDEQFSVSDVRVINRRGKPELQWEPAGHGLECAAVILAVGFGEERTVEPLTKHSYWDDDDLSSPGTFAASKRCLISGSGDGGLTDVLRASIAGFRHHTFVKELGLDPSSSQAAEKLAQLVEQVEERAQRCSQDDRGEVEAAEMLTKGYLSDEMKTCGAFIDEKLKDRSTGRAVTLNHTGDDVLTRKASALNRLLVSRLIHLGRVKRWPGKLEAGAIQHQPGSHYKVTIDGRSKDFDRVIIRQGVVSALEKLNSSWAQKCKARLEPHSILDLTRKQLWPDGWLRDGSGSTPPAVGGGSGGGAGSVLPTTPEATQAAPVRHSVGVPRAAKRDQLVGQQVGQSVRPTPKADYSPDNASHYIPYPTKRHRLIGRQDSLDDLARQLAMPGPPYPRVALSGIGGLGKTQLAAEYCHQHQTEYVGGIYWLDAALDLDGQLIELCDRSKWLHPASKHAEKLSVARQRLLSHADSLLVFDNVEDIETIRPYFPDSSRNSRVLALSRLEVPGWSFVRLDPLSSRDSLLLLEAESGRTAATQVEQDAANAIAKQLDGLPLALELVGAYLKHRPAATWAQCSADLKIRGMKAGSLNWKGFDEASLTNHGADLHAALSLDEVLFTDNPLMRSVLNLLAWAGAASIGESLLSELLAKPEPGELMEALALSEQLRILSVETDANGHQRFRMHRLVQQVRRQDVHKPNGPELAAQVQRLGDWFVARREDFADLPAFEAELEHLRTYQGYVDEEGLWEAAARLRWLEAYPPFHRGQYSLSHAFAKAARDVYARNVLNVPLLNADLLGALGSTYRALGQPQEALKLDQQALAISREVLGEKHPDTATALGNLGSTYSALGQPQEALKLEQQALAIRREVQGEKHPDTATALGNLGATYRALGQPQEALKLAQQALAISREVLGEKHPDTATALGNLGSTYSALGQPQEALKLEQQTLAISREVQGEKHPDTATALGNLGATYSALGQPQEALKLAQQALAISREVQGEKHPDTATALGNLGATYRALGQPQEALKLDQQALAISREVLGEKHPDTATALGNLGSTYSALGQPQEALKLAQQALAISREVLGEKHPDTATALGNLGATYSALGQPQEALKLAQQALAIRREVQGEKHPDTATALGNLGATYSALGQPQEALKLEQQALAIRREVLGEKHPDTATALGNLGSTYRALGQPQEALKLAQQALAISREVQGEKHPDTATALGHLGATYSALGQPQEALKLAQQALAISREVQGEKHPDTATALGNLGSTYSALGQPQEALKLDQQVLAIRREVQGEKHPDTATALGNLGATYSALGQPQEALKLAQQALAISREVQGEKHPDTATALSNLGATYLDLGKHELARKHADAALAVRSEVLGELHPDTVSNRIDLSHCWTAINQVNEARNILREGMSKLPKESAAYAQLKQRLNELSDRTQPGFRQRSSKKSQKPKKRG